MPPSEPERPSYSLLRIQDPQGNDIVTIDPCTGTVMLHDADRVDDAAWTFWGAVTTIFGVATSSRDILLRASQGGLSQAGDFVFHPGLGIMKDAPGGDLIVKGPTVDELADLRSRIEKAIAASDSDPEYVVHAMLDELDPDGSLRASNQDPDPPRLRRLREAFPDLPAGFAHLDHEAPVGWDFGSKREIGVFKTFETPMGRKRMPVCSQPVFISERTPLGLTLTWRAGSTWYNWYTARSPSPMDLIQLAAFHGATFIRSDNAIRVAEYLRAYELHNEAQLAAYQCADG